MWSRAMRSQVLFRRSKALLNVPARFRSRPVLSSSSPPLPRRNESSRTTGRGKRLSSSIPSSSASGSIDPAPVLPEDGSGGPDPQAEESEKPKQRRTRVGVTTNKDPELFQLPDGLDILWSPAEESVESDERHASTLPPPEIFDDALNNLLITLHPQTQHRATYASPLGPPTEPTLALYCPIEGGDYVIDATVRELARRSGAEVLVLDAVQLAAGEWGHFGAAANSLSLSRNPLHFSPSPPATNSRAPMMDEDDEPDTSTLFSQPRQMTLTVLTPSAMQGRSILTSPPRRSSPPSKIKVFFDTLVNAPSKHSHLDTSHSTKGRPRIVYIRDFPTLAPSSSAWYPPLLSAVRERRRGPISRPSSPVMNPMTVIFGMTPSLTPPTSYGPSSSGLMSLLMSRNTPTAQIAAEPKTATFEWGEGEAPEKAREKRLRDRLKKWEKGDAALHDELPKLSTTREGEASEDKPEIIFIGGSHGMPGFAPMISQGAGRTGIETESSFFRFSILVPSERSTVEERAIRVARRREINELTMRMGVGAAGGTLEQQSALNIHADHSSAMEISEHGNIALQSDHLRMWEDWGNKVEVWANVRRIADRAIGHTLSVDSNLEKATLNPTEVPWSVVHQAWAANQSSRDLRKTWLRTASLPGTLSREHDEDEDVNQEQHAKSDEVIEKIKHDSDLDPHEQRLLPCIVDSASMPTSFDQVHLPPHTIDSVRTIVSLPLLHPQAFQQGILKQHGMTGCLLFGPPGTGKTLVVRALAKEAGCRMIAISPSDVMDMYVGEGEKLVKAVFSLARRLSPCVVFLDEIDALFGARMPARDNGGAFAHRGVITEFMQEMDGLKTSKEDRVIVIGATNRPFDLDDAVLRRLPRRLLVDLPGKKEREEILKILLRDEMLGDDVDIQALAKKTESFSGSDLKHLCVSAALDAVKENVLLPWSTTDVLHGSLPPLLQRDTPPQSVSSGPCASLEISSPSPSDSDSSTSPSNGQLSRLRTLRLHNFTKALKEITPSSSETLGSLADLRKWNDEFGEGRRDKRRKQFWGKDRFGFTDTGHGRGDDGRVLHGPPDISTPKAVEGLY